MINSLFKVNGKPFFSIGGQVNNSSAYTAESMKRAVIAAKKIGMNTIAAPVYWETLEREEGIYDFSQVHMLLETAREAELHLILLWFGTWKNGNSHYVPEWIKLDHERFFWAECADHTPVRALSPHCREACRADKAAFSSLCAFLAEKNKDGTVIALQVENEPGIMGTPRDYGDEAEKLFRQSVPEQISDFIGRRGTWDDIFGFDSAEYFTTYFVARYIDEIAKEAKKILDLPLYTNVWLGEMHNRIAGIDYPAGGAVTKTIEIFRLAAPHLDTISPDIYLQDEETWSSLNKTYQDGIHAYYIPELLPSALASARMIQAVVKHGLCGAHYFGIDMFVEADGKQSEKFSEAADAMKILKDMKPFIEKYQGTDKLYAVAQFEGMSKQYVDFGDFVGSVRFDDTNGDLLAKVTDKIMDNEHVFNPGKKCRAKGLICYDRHGTFYLAGNNYRLMLFPKNRIESMTSAVHSTDFQNQRCQPFLSVEEGYLEDDGKFCAVKRRNGDEADYGFWVTSDVGVVRVRVDTDF